MISSREFLKEVIKAIKLSKESKGEKITLEDIAQKVGFSEEQLQLFLNGNAKIPEELPTQLLTSYGFITERIRDVHTFVIIEPK